MSVVQVINWSIKKRLTQPSCAVFQFCFGQIVPSGCRSVVQREPVPGWMSSVPISSDKGAVPDRAEDGDGILGVGYMDGSVLLLDGSIHDGYGLQGHYVFFGIEWRRSNSVSQWHWLQMNIHSLRVTPILCNSSGGSPSPANCMGLRPLPMSLLQRCLCSTENTIGTIIAPGTGLYSSSRSFFPVFPSAECELSRLGRSRLWLTPESSKRFTHAKLQPVHSTLK